MSQSLIRCTVSDDCSATWRSPSVLVMQNSALRFRRPNAIAASQRLPLIKLAMLLGGFLLLLLMATAAQAAPQKTQLRSLTVKPVNGKLVLNFNLNQKTKYKVFGLSSPERVVIDFKNTVALPNALKFRTGTSNYPIKKIRSSPREGHDLRVVLDLSSSVGVMSNVKRASHGSTVEVILSNPNIAPSTNKRIQDAKEKAQRIKEATKQRQAPTSSPRNRGGKFVVVIDAGHGGKDPGAIGPRGTQEKRVVLNISKKLKTLIDREPGMRAVMTRSDDRFIGLRERIEKANDYNADLFVSVHANANRNRKIKGSSVYILSQSGASSEAARFIAARENAYFGKMGNDLFRGKNQMIRSVLLDLSKSSTLERSHSLAKTTLSEMKQVNRLQHGLRVESANFAVLKSLHIPSMLVETAHISNPNEEQKLSQQNYQSQMAFAIFQGVKQYYNKHVPKTVRYTGGNKYRVRPGDTLSEIASRYGISLSQLRQANNLSSNNIRSGQHLIIP